MGRFCLFDQCQTFSKSAAFLILWLVLFDYTSIRGENFCFSVKVLLATTFLKIRDYKYLSISLALWTNNMCYISTIFLIVGHFDPIFSDLSSKSNTYLTVKIPFLHQFIIIRNTAKTNSSPQTLGKLHLYHFRQTECCWTWRFHTIYEEWFICKCCSLTGKRGGGQDILVNGCGETGEIIHELGHVIGFRHEHQQPDGDEYVKIKKDNYLGVDNHFNVNYGKLSADEVDTLNEPYDYDSIMHYYEASESKYSSAIGTFEITGWFPDHIENLSLTDMLMVHCTEKRKKWHSAENWSA